MGTVVLHANLYSTNSIFYILSRWERALFSLKAMPIVSLAVVAKLSLLVCRGEAFTDNRGQTNRAAVVQAVYHHFLWYRYSGGHFEMCG